jgi:hypothetical protein
MRKHSEAAAQGNSRADEEGEQDGAEELVSPKESLRSNVRRDGSHDKNRSMPT